jgi:hypothetical protein
MYCWFPWKAQSLSCKHYFYRIRSPEIGLGSFVLCGGGGQVAGTQEHHTNKINNNWKNWHCLAAFPLFSKPNIFSTHAKSHQQLLPFFPWVFKRACKSVVITAWSRAVIPAMGNSSHAWLQIVTRHVWQARNPPVYPSQYTFGSLAIDHTMTVENLVVSPAHPRSQYLDQCTDFGVWVP